MQKLSVIFYYRAEYQSDRLHHCYIKHVWHECVIMQQWTHSDSFAIHILHVALYWHRIMHMVMLLVTCMFSSAHFKLHASGDIYFKWFSSLCNFSFNHQFCAIWWETPQYIFNTFFFVYACLYTCCSHFLTIIAGVDLHFRHESKLPVCRTLGLNPGRRGARRGC